ncbi:hypothetical protein B0H16DRAFT_518350 [Mycena metata]|uniref:GDP/GTP exchange factor Sec2 N-terminal domain-containing protein n=1 Tax=Mycena metata TaxID=1033252 RepID=A0AAD7JHB6_9AGAR|nr:hypothetical protein B0H16DRAFT_518350 [Mycena metata]
MLHFASSFPNGGGSNNSVPRRTDSLNATQQKAPPPSHQIFLTIEQELHDARRVSSHGQEEDLRSALNMVISRVTELSSLLSEAYKSKAELEVQLNVAKSNLQLVIANNEMLEEALKSNSGQHNIGWRRASGAGSTSNPSHGGSGSVDSITSTASASTTQGQGGSPVSANNSPTEAASNSRFFKTFFSNGGTRPSTPTLPPTHLTSPSLPSLHHAGGAEDDALQTALQAARATAEQARQAAERERQLAIRERKAADKARADAVAAARDKAALEAEIESLSQALFEEANNMVASERKRRAELEGELKAVTAQMSRREVELGRLREEIRGGREAMEELEEVREEREALKSALRVVEGENVELRSSSRMSQSSDHSFGSQTHGRNDSYGSLAHSRGGSQESFTSAMSMSSNRKRSSSELGQKSPVGTSSFPASPQIPSASAPASASASPHIPTSSSSFANHEESDEDADITFAPTGLGLGVPGEDADSDDERPMRTPRKGVLGSLPLPDDVPPIARKERRESVERVSALPADEEDADGQWVDVEARAERRSMERVRELGVDTDAEGLRSRTSSPGFSPPPTAVAPGHGHGQGVEDPWAGA